MVGNDQTAMEIIELPIILPNSVRRTGHQNAIVEQGAGSKFQEFRGIVTVTSAGCFRLG